MKNRCPRTDGYGEVLPKPLIRNTFVQWSVSPSVKVVPAGGMTISWSGAWRNCSMGAEGGQMMEATTAFRADPMAGSMLGDISDEEAMMKIMADCEKMPEMTLMDSMHMNM